MSLAVATPPNPEKDARRALARAMITIGRAEDPLATFEDQRETIEQAVATLGRDFDAQAFFKACGLAAGRVSLPTGADATDALPVAAEKAFREMLVSELGVRNPDGVRIVDVVGGAPEGWEFSFIIDGEEHSGFAIFYRGGWFFAPGPVGAEELDVAQQAFVRHFDFLIATGMHARGNHVMRIAKTREGLRPTRALWPHEKDPHERCDDMPLVFVFHNASDSGRRYFCAYDPITDECEPYDSE